MLASRALVLLLVAPLVGCPGAGNPFGPAGIWLVSDHPCTGNRTDALWVEGSDAWLGCGTTTTGEGLFESTDSGATWTEVATNPPGFFDDFRVNTVSRSADGLLYVGGTGGDDRVVALDTSSVPYEVTSVLEFMGQTWNGASVGTFRRSADGYALSESKTGADVAWRASDSDPFQDGSGWWEPGPSVQILDMTEHDGSFYGAGSTISQPPHVFLPGPGDVPLTSVVLTEDYDGEMNAVAVDAGGIVVGGVDQRSDVGVVFSAPLDAEGPEDFTQFRVDVLDDSSSTWIRGLCRDGDTVVAVGEYSQLGGGLVLWSDDGGATFVDATPEDAPAVHRCVFADDGFLHVAGGGGWYGRL